MDIANLVQSFLSSEHGQAAGQIGSAEASRDQNAQDQGSSAQDPAGEVNWPRPLSGRRAFRDVSIGAFAGVGGNVACLTQVDGRSRRVR